jgi:peptide/nickel transport system permease protein
MTVSTALPAAVPPGAALRPGRAARKGRGRLVLGVLAGFWLVAIAIATTLAPALAPHDPYTQNLTDLFAGPSAEHLLGTDSLGRDVLSRLMHGGGTTLIGVSIAVVIFVVLGVVAGLGAGYFGGVADRGIVGLNTILQAIPGLIVLFVVLSIFRGSTFIAMVVFGVISSPTMFFLIRSTTLSVRNELFVDAAKVSGLSPFYIIFQHVLPRTRGLIVVQATVFAATALVVESTLSYLGFGAQPPEPSWGNMVSEAANQISLNPFMLYATGGTIALTSFAVGILGDMTRDRMARGWSVSKLTKDATTSSAKPVVHPMPENVLLAVDDLEVGYHSGDSIVPIVKNVSFTIGRGEIVGLVGESGSGKTTVAFGVLGVIGEGVAITHGSVIFDGTDLVGRSGRELAAFRGKRIAYVAQEPMVALDPNYRVGTQLAEAVRTNDGLTGAAVQSRVLELLGLVELPDPAGVSRKYPHELSGGMAQRVSIAFALAGRPELLVADEPTTALDVTVQAGILGLLLRLREQTGMSMLIITHDWGVVADVCDRVVVMYKGEIVEQAAAATIFAHPVHEYTKALLASNPHGAPAGVDLPVITGSFRTPSMDRELAANEGATR